MTAQEQQEQQAQEQQEQAQEQQERHEHPAERMLPWRGTPSRADLTCFITLSVYGWVIIALSVFAKPALIGTHPTVLALLTGSYSAVVAAAAFASVGLGWLPLVVLCGVIGTVLIDPVAWWAGRLWGGRAIEIFSGRSPRVERWAERIRRGAARYGRLVLLAAFVVPVPRLIVVIVTGWAGMRLRVFLLFNTLGATVQVGLLAALGYRIGQPAVGVAQSISNYALLVSGGLLVLFILRQAWRARR